MPFEPQQVVEAINNLDLTDFKNLIRNEQNEYFYSIYDEFTFQFKLKDKDTNTQFEVYNIKLNKNAISVEGRNTFAITQRIEGNEISFFPQQASKEGKEINNYFSKDISKNYFEEITNDKIIVSNQYLNDNSLTEYAKIHLIIILARLNFIYDTVNKATFKLIPRAIQEKEDKSSNNQQTQPTPYMPQEIKINSVNTILYGPPGTGKTYHTINLACQVLSKEEELPDNRTYIKEKYESLIKEGRIMFTTFHQSMSYEDFIEGIKPCIENDEVTYKVQNGIFKDICHKAKTDPDNKYMLIIDEINRGNVASIFGELITLIEDSKRAGEGEAISVILPYSKEEFSVPKNLYILGTMNTADRSVEALDAALRRRFDFIEMLPQTNNLPEIDGINLKDVLETINARIEALLDRNHLIGHAYLINAKNKNDIAQAFNNKIIPLLQEYFYGNYDRIAMVLGSEFVKAVDVTNSFGTKYNDIDLSDKKSYTFPKQNEDSIVNAINNLLGKPNANADESEA